MSKENSDMRDWEVNTDKYKTTKNKTERDFLDKNRFLTKRASSEEEKDGVSKPGVVLVLAGVAGGAAMGSSVGTNIGQRVGKAKTMPVALGEARKSVEESYRMQSILDEEGLKKIPDLDRKKVEQVKKVNEARRANEELRATYESNKKGISEKFEESKVFQRNAGPDSRFWNPKETSDLRRSYNDNEDFYNDAKRRNDYSINRQVNQQGILNDMKKNLQDAPVVNDKYLVEAMRNLEGTHVYKDALRSGVESGRRIGNRIGVPIGAIGMGAAGLYAGNKITREKQAFIESRMYFEKRAGDRTIKDELISGSLILGGGAGGLLAGRKAENLILDGPGEEARMVMVNKMKDAMKEERGFPRKMLLAKAQTDYAKEYGRIANKALGTKIGIGVGGLMTGLGAAHMYGKRQTKEAFIEDRMELEKLANYERVDPVTGKRTKDLKAEQLVNESQDGINEFITSAGQEEKSNRRRTLIGAGLGAVGGIGAGYGIIRGKPNAEYSDLANPAILGTVVGGFTGRLLPSEKRKERKIKQEAYNAKAIEANDYFNNNNIEYKEAFIEDRMELEKLAKKRFTAGPNGGSYYDPSQEQKMYDDAIKGYRENVRKRDALNPQPGGNLKTEPIVKPVVNDAAEVVKPVVSNAADATNKATRKLNKGKVGLAVGGVAAGGYGAKKLYDKMKEEKTAFIESRMMLEKRANFPEINLSPEPPLKQITQPVMDVRKTGIQNQADAFNDLQPKIAFQTMREGLEKNLLY